MPNVGSQRKMSFTHERPVAQESFITRVLSLRHLHHVPQFNIVELGCAEAYLLSRLALSVRSANVTVTCFEADPTKAVIALGTLKQFSPLAAARVINAPFNASLFPPHSVDLVVSSQVFEHIPTPCETLHAIRQVLRTGGHVFTEVPAQDRDHLTGHAHGVFHVSFFNGSTLNKMMLRSGFDLVAADPNSGSRTRQIHRMGSPNFERYHTDASTIRKTLGLSPQASHAGLRHAEPCVTP